MSDYTPTTRVYGHGSITLTHYPSSGRLGVVQVGTNAVMDSWELVEFAREAGLLAEHDAALIESLADEWAADPDAWGDNDKDYRNELRDRAQQIREGGN